MHYFRIHPDYWADRLARAKAMGINTVEVGAGAGAIWGPALCGDSNNTAVQMLAHKSCVPSPSAPAGLHVRLPRAVGAAR